MQVAPEHLLEIRSNLLLPSLGLKTVAAGVLMLSVDVDETNGGSKFLVITIGPLADMCQRPHERPAYWRQRVLDSDRLGIVHRPSD